MLDEPKPSGRELLRDYQTTFSEEAFRALVHLYVDFVYGIACRKTGRTGTAVEDIVQTVFIDLSRKAPCLSTDRPLGGWLHCHTHFIASKFLRAERRRKERERTALEMNALHQNSDAEDRWQQLSPILDDALNQLRLRDRDVIVLRFFEDQSLRRVGESLGVSEGAAQKRLARALDRLRVILERQGLKCTSVGILTTTLQSHAAMTLAPAAMGARIAAGAMSGAAPSTSSTLMTSMIMMTKTKVAAFVCLAGLTTLGTLPLARPTAPGAIAKPVAWESVLSPQTAERVPKPGRDLLREIWATERLVNTDPDRALQLCLDGASTDRVLWEKLLQKLLPERVEDALQLIIKGRCFRSPQDRGEAIEIFIETLPLEVVVAQAEGVANSAGPGAEPLLEQIMDRWARVDPEAARQGALDLTNPLRRQYGLASALAASEDLGSEAWTLAFEQLTPSLRIKAVEPLLALDGIEEQIVLLNEYLRNHQQWDDLVMRAFKASSSPREAYEIAVRDGLTVDEGLLRSLTEWAAQDDPELYIDLFESASEEERWSVLRQGFQALLEALPEQAFRMVEENPELLDSWTVSVLGMGAKTPQHLERVRALLDSSDELKEHYMSVTNYLYAVARRDPEAFISRWEGYSSVYSAEQKAHNIRNLIAELWESANTRIVATGRSSHPCGISGGV